VLSVWWLGWYIGIPLLAAYYLIDGHSVYFLLYNLVQYYVAELVDMVQDVLRHKTNLDQYEEIIYGSEKISENYPSRFNDPFSAW
jgi:hypothetical protein